MGTYPIKLLRDEQGTPFVPLVSSDSVQTLEGEKLTKLLDDKLSPEDLVAGQYIELNTEEGKTTISVDLPASVNTINNLTTETSGQGALDAYQGKVLKDSIPDLVDSLDSTDANKALSARQGKILNEKTVPEGGKVGQVLKKSSNNDHELEWGDAADPNAIGGDGSIKKIVSLTLEEYNNLTNPDPLTEYHIIDSAGIHASQIVDNLTTDDPYMALSARQGMILAGQSGASIPLGGAEGQVLKKSSNDDYAFEWGDAADPNAIGGDGSIMKIVELSYEEYLELEAANQLQDDTEYHINDWNENERTYLTEQDILNITSPHAIMAVIQGGKSSSTILYTLEQYGQVPLQECEQIGNSFSITSDGMIECLRNGYIEVSGKISFQKAEGTDERWLEIRKSDDNYISANPAYFSGRNMIAASPVLHHIKAGEKIQLKIDGVAGDQIRSNKEYSSIYIKYIFFD